MNNVQLVLPNITYKDSYLAALKEYQAENLAMYKDFDFEGVAADLEAYIELLGAQSKGERLPAGYIPHTTFWLVDGDEYIGRVDIRHELNDFLKKEGGHIGYDIRPTKRRMGYGTLALELGLKKTKELGLQEILVTCDIDNVGSNKIIKANGGVLAEKVMSSEGKEKNKYWIKNNS